VNISVRNFKPIQIMFKFQVALGWFCSMLTNKKRQYKGITDLFTNNVLKANFKRIKETPAKKKKKHNNKNWG